MSTKLDIINHMLRVTGENTVLTLTTGHPSVNQALASLDGYDFDFQSKGWWFNTNHNMTLSQDENGNILVPAEALEFSITSDIRDYSTVSDKGQYVQRDGKIYDSVNNTFVIGHSLQADLVIRLDIEDLPAVAATYIKHKAAQEYYTDDDGDNTKIDKLANRTMLAFHALKASELKLMASNALDSPAARQVAYRVGNGQYRNLGLPGGRY